LEIVAAPLACTAVDEFSIRPATRSQVGGELQKDCLHGLPRARRSPEQRGMTAPGVPIERGQVLDQAGAQGIEVNVTHELKEVGFLFDQDRLVSVLKEMSRPPMASIEADRIAGEEPAHGAGERDGAGSCQQMEMVGEQTPGEDGESCPATYLLQPSDEIMAVYIGAEDRLAIEAPHHDMVKGARRI
jgi:hypothetical protein